jgi:hypothetical protein
MKFDDLTLMDVENLQNKYNISFLDPEQLKKPSLDLILDIVNLAREKAGQELLTKATAKYTEVIKEYGNFFSSSTPETGTKEPLPESNLS